VFLYAHSQAAMRFRVSAR